MIDEPGLGSRSTLSFLFEEVRIRQLQHKFFLRPCRRCRGRKLVRGQFHAQRCLDHRNRGLDSARFRANGDVKRFVFEELSQDSELRIVEAQRNDREFGSGFLALALDLERVLEFRADPFGLQRRRTNEQREGVGSFNRLLQFVRQNLAAA